MSRTDKDRPYWVRSNDKAYEDRVCFYLIGRRSFYSTSPSWWTAATVTTPQRARARARLSEAKQMYRGDPEAFMEDWDYGPAAPYEPDYW